MRRAAGVGRGKGLAIAGLVAGIAALLVSIVGIIWSVRVMDAVIDFVDSLNGGGFKISNPNARQSCGCGKSFEA